MVDEQFLRQYDLDQVLRVSSQLARVGWAPLCP